MWILLLLIALMATIIFIYFIAVEPAKKHLADEGQKNYIHPDLQKSEIVALAKDPGTIYAYWDLADEVFQDFRARYGKEAWENSEPLIRVYDLSDGKIQLLKEIPVDLKANNHYIEVDSAGRVLKIELGILLPDRQFLVWARSEAVDVPAADFSNVVDPYWPPVENVWKTFSPPQKTGNIDTVSSQSPVAYRPHSRN